MMEMPGLKGHLKDLSPPPCFEILELFVSMLHYVLILVVKILAEFFFLIFQIVVLVVFLVMVNFFLLLLLEN